MSTKDLVATYGMIQNYKNQPTNKWLALAEFIDNSISSWLVNKDSTNNNLNGLEISIVFDQENKSIFIIDNANGMDADELVNSLQPSDTQGKSELKYNQYGVGMKLGIFWYGEDAKIYSKKHGIENYTELCTSKHDSNEKVTVVSEKSRDDLIPYDSGTYIKIEKIYRNRIWKKDDFNLIIRALGWRYGKLLMDQKQGIPGMQIWVTHKTSDKKIRDKKEDYVTPYSIKPLTIESFKEVLRKKERFNFIKFQNEYMQEIENLMFQHPNNELLLEFCRKLKNNEPLISEEEIIWWNCGERVVLKFGIIDITHKSEGYAKICGVTTLHLNRAINHGPNDRDNESKCLSFRVDSSESSGGESTWRRLFGEVNLTGVERPDQNKSRFDWSYEGKEQLDEALRKIWNNLKPLLDLIVGFEKKEKYVMNSPLKNFEDKEKAVEFAKKTLDLNKLYINVEECPETQTDQPCFYLKEYGKKIWIIENEDLHSDFVSLKEDDEKMYVYYNVNHKFWKSFINQNDKEIIEFRGKTIYPLVLLVALCNEELKDRHKSKKSLMFFGYDSEPRDFVEIMNVVIKAIESKNEN